MEPFYRRLRRRLEILVDADGQPVGGRWNFDPMNRRPLPPGEAPPPPAGFAPDGYWRLMPALREANAWGARRRLPRFFADGATDMRCLRHALGRTLSTGYTHHIERLMLLANFCLLAGVRPRAVTDWFLAAYVDAYDWVMQTNVVGMGLNADGGQVATKPYVASEAYIHRMSDYCGGCRYDRRRRTGPDACPFNTLYWNFLLAHERRLRANPRLSPAVLGLRRLDTAERRAVRTTAGRLLRALDRA